MKQFEIKFREVLVNLVTVEADTLDEALEKADQMYEDCDVMLFPEDIVHSERISHDRPYIEYLSDDAIAFLEGSVGRILSPDAPKDVFRNNSYHFFEDEKILKASKALASEDLVDLVDLYKEFNPDNDIDPSVLEELMSYSIRMDVLKYLMYSR